MLGNTALWKPATQKIMVLTGSNRSTKLLNL